MSSAMRLLLGVVAGGLLLGPWGVAAGPHGLSALPPVADPGPCAPPRDAATHVGLRGYGRFFANDSLIGRRVPCTRDDKICFRHNLVFDPEQDICDYIGGGHKQNCDLRPDRAEFEKGSGRIIGVCKSYEDPCPGYRMAYDGRCYRKEVVRDVICGCRAKPTRHFLEGVECRTSPATPVTTPQPDAEGHCRIPDLRFPDIERSEFFQNSFASLQGFEGSRTGVSFKVESPSLKCNTDQAACFSQGKVWMYETKGCYRLLEQGPCPKEHVVAMDIHAAVKGRAEATCVHERGGCPQGHKRMVFDGECHEDREVKIEAPGSIVLNQYGHQVLIPHGFGVSFNPTKANNSCIVRISAVGPGLAGRSPNPPCGPNNQGRCDLFEVESDVPKPEL